MRIEITPTVAIGDHEPVFIVAEVGSNWKTLDDCLHSIVMAKACGADAVKFQLLNYEALYGRSGVQPTDHWKATANLISGGQWDGKDYATELWNVQQGYLPLAWLPKLKAHADAAGIEFMCSAFSPELIDAVDPFVNVHKVASAEMTHVRMLEKLAKIGKPVILSTGASGDQDITFALKILEGFKFDTEMKQYVQKGEFKRPLPVVLLYCIAAYPARQVRLEHIDDMRRRFDVPLVGFSDHSTDIFTIPSEAIFQHKACVLEKHFTVIEAQTPDRDHSLTIDEFRLMVQRARNDRVLKHRQSGEEHGMILRHNRRLIATKDIAPGEAFIEGGNFGIYRSLKDDTKALSPFAIDHVIGKLAKLGLKAGDGIGPGDLA